MCREVSTQTFLSAADASWSIVSLCLKRTFTTTLTDNSIILASSKKWVIRKEGNVLFNDALKIFYLRLYGVRHMVKDHSDSEKGNPLPLHRLLFPISSKGSFICTIPHTVEHIPRPLLHQSWITGWNEK